MARPGSSNFASRFQPRFNPKETLFEVRKTITCEMGTFNVGEAFVVEDIVSLGFTTRRVGLLYDRKHLKLFDKGVDTKALVEAAKEKLGVWALEKSSNEAIEKAS